jgi:potassium efflux system protein
LKHTTVSVRRIARAARWCTAIWLLTLSGAAVAAEATAEAASTDDVGEWSRQAAQRLFEIRERLSGPSDVAAAQQRLATLKTRFDENVGDLLAHPDAANSLTESAIRDAQHEIDAIASAAKDIGQLLTQRNADLDGLMRELVATQARAKALRDGTGDVELADAIRARLDKILLESTQSIATARQRLDRVAALQNQVLLLDERARIGSDDLTRSEAKRVKALFELQQPPLWRVSMSDIATAAAGSTRFAGQALPGALQFSHDHPARMVWLGVVIVLALSLVFYLRRTFGAAVVGAPVSRATTRPVSASLLVVLLIAPFLYPDAPSSVVQILGIILIVPLLRILTLYLEPQLHVALYCLIATFLLERVTSAFARDVVLQRTVLLVLNVATIALFAWARSLQVGAHLGLGRRVAGIVRRLALVGIGLSALSLVFGVIGNVDLAMILQSTTVRAATIAAGLYAAVRVIDEVAHLCVHTLKARGVRSVTNYEQQILSRTRTLVTIAAFAAWTAALLFSLRLLSPLTTALGEILGAQWTVGQITLSLGRSLGFVVAVGVAVFASRITQVLLRDDVLPRFALPRGVPNAISTVANYAMILIGILLGAGILGIELSNVALIVSALGVGIGFGLQNVVNNLVSGFILIFERSVQIGDIVQLDALQGRVTQIGLRASRLRTFNGSEVIVPNGELISNRLINWTLSDRRRRYEATVGVAYGSDLEQVHAVLRAVLDAESEVVRDPEPMVIFEGFGDSALNFRLYYWVHDLDIGLSVTDRINTAIATALAAAQIEIPFPQRDLHVKSLPS